MLRCWIIALLACAGPLAARQAVVMPASGPVLRGVVRLTDRGLLLVNPDLDLIAHLPLTNLFSIVFESLSPTDQPPPIDGPPDPWNEVDIGEVARAGSTLRQGETLTLRSAGLGLSGPADSFHYVFQRAEGDVEIVARLATVHHTDSTAKGGVMIREKLSSGSRAVAVGLTPGCEGFVAWRESEDGTTLLRAQAGWSAPGWVRLKREGDSFAAFRSPNGLQWTFAGRVRVDMGAKIYVGLASASGRGGVLNWTVFDRVTVGSNLFSQVFPPRAELVSGSIVVGRPVSAGADQIDFWWGFGKVSLPEKSIARLVFQWAAPAWVARTRGGQSGVWLAGGEFLESDFRAVDGGRLRVNSVLYGARTLDAHSEVVAMTLHRSRPGAARFEVRTVNGTCWRAQDLALGNNEVVLQEPVLGLVRVPIHELDVVSRL